MISEITAFTVLQKNKLRLFLLFSKVPTSCVLKRENKRQSHGVAFVL